MKSAISESVVAADIEDLLPHRHPNLFVDKIVEESEKRIVGIKNVSANEIFFLGHFPEQPVMPGVLVLEGLVQTAWVLVRKIACSPDKTPAWVGSDRVRFRKPVLPGDQLILEVELVEWNGNSGKIKGIAKVGEQVVASGDLSLALE